MRLTILMWIRSYSDGKEAGWGGTKSLCPTGRDVQSLSNLCPLHTICTFGRVLTEGGKIKYIVK
jgi:hypothetical protein